LQALQALTGILPLLGLLGTVSGMIKVFEVITVFGTGNTRGMASGISEALVTTMAGLFTALSGLYFVSDLENRSQNLALRFETELVEGD
jgi:biopolymer transport protein ExbB